MRCVDPEKWMKAIEINEKNREEELGGQSDGFQGGCLSS
jgi:hypothetical protein